MAVNGTVLRLAQTVAPIFFTLFYWIGDLKAVYFAGAAVSVLMLYITITRVSSTLRH